MTKKRVSKIEKKLIKSFSPEYLLVKDQSHLHVGHHGAKDGLGHFEIIISSGKFVGLSRLATHKLVFDALGEMMKTDIHALTIKIGVR
tara:strand:- start:7398 stop:7661 length:264 start_codon:yes stop_codon:yes gene_type:complete